MMSDQEAAAELGGHGGGCGLPVAARRTADARLVQSLLKAVDVLEVLAQGERALGVSDIARRAGISKAGAYAILRTLMACNFVVRDHGTPTYRLGWALYELGSSVVRNTDLSRVARVYLDELAQETRDSVLLGIIDQDSVLFLDRGESPDRFHMVADSGRRSPILASASGKAIAAFYSDEMMQMLLRKPVRRYTAATVTDKRKLRDELRRVRECGYATCWQEAEAGLSSIGVPLRDHSGDVVAALTIAGPSERVNPHTAQRLVPLLRKTAAAIEERLGAPVARRDLGGSY
jgi:IclR family KDG regulon transcriptional repressor